MPPLSPLQGLRVLVTRAKDDDDALFALLLARGALPLALPCIRFAPPEDEAALDAHLRSLADKPPAALVLSSPRVVRELENRLKSIQCSIHNILHSVDVVITAGPGTARALPLGLAHVHVPSTVGATGMIDALGQALGGRLSAARVAIPRAEGGGRSVEEWLEAQGAHVESFPLYRTRPNDPRLPEVADGLAALRAAEVDCVTFASSSAVRGLVQLFGRDTARACAPATVACMGVPSAKAAEQLGLRVDAVADGDFSALVAALAAAVEQRRGS